MQAATLGAVQLLRKLTAARHRAGSLVGTNFQAIPAYSSYSGSPRWNRQPMLRAQCGTPSSHVPLLVSPMVCVCSRGAQHGECADGKL